MSFAELPGQLRYEDARCRVVEREGRLHLEGPGALARERALLALLGEEGLSAPAERSDELLDLLQRPFFEGERGAYLLERAPAAHGGQATVWRARALSGGGRVAVKLAHSSEQCAQALRQEARTLRLLGERYPAARGAIVALLDQGTAPDQRPFLVEPWYDHGDLYNWCRSSSPPLSSRLDALCQAVAAVGYLHTIAIPDEAGQWHPVRVHRDLKPHNFLVGEQEGRLRVVLSDLGTYRSAEQRPEGGLTGVFTPLYSPLDQQLPSANALDPSWDIHALGVMVFETLVGTAPASLLQRIGLLTEEGVELYQLHQSRLSGVQIRGAQARRYNELAALPLGSLLRLDSARPLSDEDRGRLSAALREALPEAPQLQRRLLELLLPPLEGALEADPRRRHPNIFALHMALQEVRSLLPEASELPGSTQAEEPPPSPTLVPSPPPKRAPSSAPSAWALAALGFGVLMGSLGLAIGTIAWLRRGGPAGEEAPAARGAEPEVGPPPAPAVEPAAPAAGEPAPEEPASEGPASEEPSIHAPAGGGSSAPRPAPEEERRPRLFAERHELTVQLASAPETSRTLRVAEGSPERVRLRGDARQQCTLTVAVVEEGGRLRWTAMDEEGHTASARRAADSHPTLTCDPRRGPRWSP